MIKYLPETILDYGQRGSITLHYCNRILNAILIIRNRWYIHSLVRLVL